MGRQHQITTVPQWLLNRHTHRLTIHSLTLTTHYYTYTNTHILQHIYYTGSTYYLSALSQKDRIDWLLHVRRALECSFGNDSVKDYKPSKYIQQRPRLQSSKICAKLKIPLTNTTTTTTTTNNNNNTNNTNTNNIYCRMCGRMYSSIDYVSDTSTMLQIGVEETDKCCQDCKNTQICIIYLKCINYTHLLVLHEMSDKVNNELISNYKNTYKLRRKKSVPLDMAGQLYDQKSITYDEFRDLQVCVVYSVSVVYTYCVCRV